MKDIKITLVVKPPVKNTSTPVNHPPKISLEVKIPAKPLINKPILGPPSNVLHKSRSETHKKTTTAVYDFKDANAVIEATYLMPLYGQIVRRTFDNKRIYSADGEVHIGTVVDDVVIWVRK